MPDPLSETDTKTPLNEGHIQEPPIGGWTPLVGPASIHSEMRRLRLVALYHNCMSSAAFKREDALRETDENERKALRREAQAFEQCAGWLSEATR